MRSSTHSAATRRRGFSITPLPHHRLRQGLCAAVSALVLALIPALAGPVAAHAELTSSTPAPSTVLLDGPPEISLTFSEEIDPQTAVVELLDTGQRAIAGIGSPVVETAGTTLGVELPALDPGVYTVRYQVVSAVDGHATAGVFSFVFDPTGTEPAPVSAPSSTSPSVDAAAVAARWIALAGLLVALGSLVMWWNAGREVMAARAPDADRRPPWLLIGASSCVAFVALAVYLSLAARPIVAALGGGHGGHDGAGFPFDFAASFGWTPFAIAMRVALAGCLVGFVIGLFRYFSLQDRIVSPGTDRRLASAAAVILAIGLAGMSMAGHAAANGGAIFGAMDWLHLVSIAAWLGALPAALVLARRVSTPRAPALRGLLVRHSRVALVAGPVTVLTGLANSPLVLGAPRDLVASDYGNLLIAKAVLVGIALGLGAINHLALRRRERPNMRLLIGLDISVGLLAVLVGATMVTIQPAAGRQPVMVTALQSPTHLYGHAGPSTVHTAVNLPAPGPQTYQVTVSDTETGEPRTDVQKVFLTFSPPDTDLPGQRVELSADVPGLYGIAGAYTPVTGTWRLEVTVRRSGALDESTTFDLPVALPDPPELVPPPDTGIGVPAPLALLWGLLPPGPFGWFPALAAAALVGLSSWWARRPMPPGWLPVARLALVALLGVAVVGAGSRALVAAANAPGSSADIDNPVPANAESVARGERLFRANCASCHGADGSGNGPVVTVPPPGSLADAVRESSDGGLSYLMAVGVAGTPMPPFAGVLSQTDRWDIVNHLRSQFGRESAGTQPP